MVDWLNGPVIRTKLPLTSAGGLPSREAARCSATHERQRGVAGEQDPPRDRRGVRHELFEHHEHHHHGEDPQRLQQAVRRPVRAQRADQAGGADQQQGPAQRGAAQPAVAGGAGRPARARRRAGTARPAGWTGRRPGSRPARRPAGGRAAQLEQVDHERTASISSTYPANRVSARTATAIPATAASGSTAALRSPAAMEPGDHRRHRGGQRRAAGEQAGRVEPPVMSGVTCRVRRSTDPTEPNRRCPAAAGRGRPSLPARSVQSSPVTRRQKWPLRRLLRPRGAEPIRRSTRRSSAARAGRLARRPGSGPGRGRAAPTRGRRCPSCTCGDPVAQCHGTGPLGRQVGEQPRQRPDQVVLVAVAEQPPPRRRRTRAPRRAARCRWRPPAARTRPPPAGSAAGPPAGTAGRSRPRWCTARRAGRRRRTR